MDELDDAAAVAAGTMTADTSNNAGSAADTSSTSSKADPLGDDAAMDAIYDKIAAGADDKGDEAGTGDDGGDKSAADDKAGDTNSDHPQKQDGEPGSSQAIAAPISWSAEAKQHWDKVPPEAQAYIAQREAEAHREITRMGEAVARYQPVGELVEQRISVFDRHGIRPDEGLSLMLDMQDMLDRDPAAGLAAIAETYGIDLAATFGGTQQGQQQQRVLDPQVQQVLQQNRQLQQRLAERENAERREAERQTQVRRQEAKDEVAKWGAEKPHFANPEIRKAMSVLFANGLADNLDHAYEQACYANPQVRALIEADAKKAAEAKALEEQGKVAADAKRSARLNAGTRSAKPAKATSAWDDDDALNATFDAVSGAA